MLFGNKSTFAIEIQVDEFFDNDFVAYGIFKIYVNGILYGSENNSGTNFYMIKLGLEKILCESNIIDEDWTNAYSENEIAQSYFDAYESTATRQTRKYLGKSADELVKSFFDFTEYTESAFDDGSNLLIQRSNGSIKLIAFKILVTQNRTVGEINSVILEKQSFLKTIQDAYDYLIKRK